MKLKKIIVNLFIFLTVFFSLSAGLFNKYFWPFYSYDMYAGLTTDSFQYYQIIGHYSKKTMVIREYKYLYPTGANGLERKVKSINKKLNRHKKLTDILRLIKHRYERYNDITLEKIELIRKSVALDHGELTQKTKVIVSI